jgi:hypothetical protein
MGLGKVPLSSIEIGAQGLACESHSLADVYFLAKTRRVFQLPKPSPDEYQQTLKSLTAMPRPKRAKANGKAPPISSAKLESATQSTQNDVLPSIEAAVTPLRETSGNRLKRPRDILDKDSDPYENTPSPKRTPTPTFFTANQYRAFREKHPIRPWKERMVTGQYTLISCRSDAGHHVDTSGFDIKVLYDCSGEERKLYATFKFDKLKGIIRLRKNLEWDLERSRLTAEAYDEACGLPSKDWPSRGRCEYSSRWRGKECGE